MERSKTNMEKSKLTKLVAVGVIIAALTVQDRAYTSPIWYTP